MLQDQRIDRPLRVRDGSELANALPAGIRTLMTVSEVIRNPESPMLPKFHAFLGDMFGADELEPIDVFKYELSEDRCVCVVIHKPIAKTDEEQQEIVSAAYGSNHLLQSEGKGFGAIRFTLSEMSHRGSNLSQLADDILINILSERSKQNGYKLEYLMCEGVSRSERFWNRMKLEAQGPGMARIFLPGMEEMFYKLAPLAWNRDGSVLADGAREHLMITGNEMISSERVAGIVNSLQRDWYIRPRDYFDTDTAFQRHQDTVSKTIENIIEPILKHRELYLFTKDEREQLAIVSYDESEPPRAKAAEAEL